MSKKVALIGSAPSSVALAPYDDFSWEIHATSPGCYPHLRRCDYFYEIHPYNSSNTAMYSHEYRSFLKNNVKQKVYMIQHEPDIPKSVPYPKDEMMREFGPFFFSSSLSWMFALAITQGATEIGLWGVDMSAQEEYGYQRAGCHFFVHEAKKRGIRITIPGQSDLLRPCPLYGYSEADPMFQKAAARRAELNARYNDAMRREQQAHDERIFLQGALDDLLYQQKTWISDPLAIAMAYQQPDWVVEHGAQQVQQVVAQNATPEKLNGSQPTSEAPVVATEPQSGENVSVAS